MKPQEKEKGAQTCLRRAGAEFAEETQRKKD
jgi:hypothetical protein